MKIKLPNKKNINDTTVTDPLQLYYSPIVRSFYIARFVDAIRLLKSHKGHLLEVGCGSGIFLCELAKHCDRLFACDLHPKLNCTAKMLRAESIKSMLINSDAGFLPFKMESMDAIVCMSVLEHIQNLESIANEFFRVLRPGGIAIVGVPVTNLMTTTLLRISYFTRSLDAKLEDEHISNHLDIFNAFRQEFLVEDILNIPRFLPEPFRMYCTVRFRKINMT